MDNGIYTIKQYGHIEINIKEIMDKKKITRNALARAIDAYYYL